MVVRYCKFHGVIYYMILIIAAVSCRNGSNIFKGTVSCPKAEHEYNIPGTRQNIFDTIGLSSIYTYDSLLIAKTIGTYNGDHFVVYSMSDMSCLGHYVTRGRGANELLSSIGKGTVRPKGTNSGFYIFDLSRNTSFVWDVGESVKDSKAYLSKLSSFQNGVLDAMPYCDSLHLIKEPMEEGLSYKVMNDKQECISEYSVYTGVPGIGFYDRLSSADAVSPAGNRLVMAMCFLPQINILDLRQSGVRQVLAINKKYKNWEQMLNMDNADLNVYYLCVCPLTECFVALYCGESMQDWLQGNYKSHLHVFSWSGKFICDITVDEGLKSIAVDRRYDMVYGLDAEDNIYRYDLSGLI